MGALEHVERLAQLETRVDTMEKAIHGLSEGLEAINETLIGMKEDGLRTSFRQGIVFGLFLLLLFLIEAGLFVWILTTT